MRALVVGQTPRAALFADLLSQIGHEVADSPVNLDFIFVLQREPDGELRVTRQEAIDALRHVVPYLTRPCTVCLVSIEPNTAWPIGMCHVLRTSLLLATAHPLKITRAHLSALPDPDFEKLILGATEDAMRSLEEAFAPMFPGEAALRISGVYEAERDADYRPDLA